MKMKKVGLLPGFAQEAGTVFVRAADDMKIAHRFVGGIKRKHESLDELFVGRSQ